MKKYFVILLTALLILLCACQKPSVGGTATVAHTNSPTAASTTAVITESPTAKPTPTAELTPTATPTSTEIAQELQELSNYIKSNFDEFETSLMRQINELYYFKGYFSQLNYFRGSSLIKTLNTLNGKTYELYAYYSKYYEGTEVAVIFSEPIVTRGYDFYYCFLLGTNGAKVSGVSIQRFLDKTEVFGYENEYIEKIGEYVFELPSNIPTKPVYEGVDAKTWQTVEQAIKHEIDTVSFEDEPDYLVDWSFPKGKYTVYILNANRDDDSFIAITKDPQNCIYTFELFLGSEKNVYYAWSTKHTKDMTVPDFWPGDLEEVYEKIKENAGHVFTYTRK